MTAASSHLSSSRRAGAPRVATWALRLAWLCVALVGGGAVAGALDERSAAVRAVGTGGALAGWAGGALALAVPAVTTLTVVRAIVPASLLVAAACAVGGATATSVLGLALPALLATIIAGSGEVGRWFVQSSAYGDEQRFPLRPPLGYLAASVATWLVMATAAMTAPLAWAARAWVLAAIATALAAVGGRALPRRWHQLSRRWLVLVPAGVVVHDPVVLADTLLLRRADVTSVRLAPASTQAADLTGPTPGTAIELSTKAAVTAVLAPTPRRPQGRAVQLTALLAAPSRPGAALEEAARRRLPMG